jgi:hypothetical protein
MFFLIVLTPAVSSDENSKGITTVPVLSLYLSDSWDTFTTSGPDHTHEVMFTITGCVGEYWNLYVRFDSESWDRHGVLHRGPCTVSVPLTSFYGSRLSLGSHRFSIQARDSSGLMSDPISVSYKVELPTGAIVGIAGCVTTAIALSITIYTKCKQWRAAKAQVAAESLASNQLLDPRLSGSSDHAPYIDGNTPNSQNLERVNVTVKTSS